jgi:hypothetical protein
MLSYGKGVYGFLTGCKGQALRVIKKNLPLSRRQFIFLRLRASVFFLINLDSPKPYTIVAYET